MHLLPPFPGTHKSKVIAYQSDTSVAAERQEFSQESSKGIRTVSLMSQRGVHGRADGTGPWEYVLDARRGLNLSTASIGFSFGTFLPSTPAIPASREDTQVRHSSSPTLVSLSVKWDHTSAQSIKD